MMGNDWIEHDGKGMPVDGDMFVEVKFADGQVASPEHAKYWLPDHVEGPLNGGDRRNYWTGDRCEPGYNITHYRPFSVEQVPA